MYFLPYLFQCYQQQQLVFAPCRQELDLLEKNELPNFEILHDLTIILVQQSLVCHYLILKYSLCPKTIVHNFVGKFFDPI